jgi:iron complex transport system permease protein
VALRTAARTPPDATAPRRGLLRGTSSRALGLWLLLVLAVAVCLLSIAVGTRPIGLGTVWQALTDATTPGDEAVIVRRLRVPRTLLGLLAGLALGISGALMQGHTRNPLGDPGLLGVTAGASFSVVLAISLLGISTPAGYIWFALAGALAGSVAVFAIGSSGRGGSPPSAAQLGDQCLPDRRARAEHQQEQRLPGQPLGVRPGDHGAAAGGGDQQPGGAVRQRGGGRPGGGQPVGTGGVQPGADGGQLAVQR